MQLSPLTDLFFASAPPAAAGPGSGLDPATAPFAQWLSSQIKSPAPLADPATPPPFSQFPLNWGFPTTSTLAAEPPAAPLGQEALLAGEVAAEALPVQVLPAEALAALPKPATSPLAALAGGGGKPAVDFRGESLKPNFPEPPRLETGLPAAAPAPIAVAAASPALEPAPAVADAQPLPTVGPAVVAAPPRREKPLAEAPAPEEAAAPSPLESLAVAAPEVLSTAATLVAESVRPKGPTQAQAKTELPVLPTAVTHSGSALPAAEAQMQSAPISPAPPESMVAAAGPQPVEPSASREARTQQAAPKLHPQPAPAAPRGGIPLDPTLVAEASQAEVDPVSPAITARSGQTANPGPQGLSERPVQAPVAGLEPAPTSTSRTAEAVPMQPPQPGWARPLEQAVRAPIAEPAPSAAVQGGGPKVVPSAPEPPVISAIAAGTTPQSLAATATLLAGQVSPLAAGNGAAGPRPVAGSRPSPTWANAGSLEAGAAVAGLTASAETGFNPALSRPVAAAADGQQPGERSLSDQRFADLFTPAAPQVQALRANTAAPQQAAAVPAAGFESLLQQPRETTGTLAQPEVTALPLVTAPLGQPAAPLAPTSPAGPLLTLPSGQQVPEQEVLQQLFAQLPSRASGPQRLTLRLNPEELGEVRLEMIIDKETVRAHLQAQSQQVQEVLEKHLPRLREAFEQQGLKLQELQVTVDSGRDGGRSFFSQSQHQQPGPSFAGSGNGRRNQGDAVAEPVTPPPARPRPSGGLSLRV